MKGINGLVLAVFLIISVYNVGANLSTRHKDVEGAILDVNLDEMVGNWTLRAATVYENDTIFTHKVIEKAGNDLKATRYFQATSQGEGTISKIPGSRVLKVDIPAHNKTKYLYPLYLDATYSVIFCVSDNDTDPKDKLAVYAKNGADYDAEDILDLLIRINEKPELKGLIKDFIFKLDFKAFNLTVFMLKPTRRFTEDELATVDHHQITSIYDLRYSTDTDRLYDYQIQFWCEKTRKFKIIRFHDGEMRQNLSDHHVFDSRRMRRTVQAVPRRSNYVKSAISIVNYLYIDQDYIVTYEFYQIYENFRVYAKQGVVGSVDEYKRVINKIPASAIAKVQDLIPKMQMQYSSTERQKEIDPTKLAGVWVIHKLIKPDHANFDKINITIDGKEVHKIKYLNNTVVDEIRYTQYPGLPSRYSKYRSIKDPSVHGANTIVFTDYTSRLVSVNNGTKGLCIGIMARPQP